MGGKYLCLVMLVTVLGIWFRAEVLQAQNLTCNQNDLRALRDFVNGLLSPIQGWSNSTSDCCNWPGITCSNSSSSSRVIEIELPKRRLTGKLVESIGNLDQLTILNLSHNFLTDSLPNSLFRMPRLKVLDLSFNDFTGYIPESISLPSITSLDISCSSLKGSVPAHICQNSTNVRVLNLEDNNFSGSFSQGFGKCSSLEMLCLGSNFLTGGIGEDIFQLPNLKVLSLQDNLLSGKLSSGIGNLLSLVRLDISMNNFSGTIPDIFGSLSNLQYFSGDSNFFVDRIPQSLASSRSINTLNLRNNSLEGSLDLDCSAMSSLVYLDLGTNKFSGPVPDNLPSCKQLKTVNLGKNNFSGDIPESFKNFQSLSFLSLSNCSLSNISSALQILQQCKSLGTLILTMNFRGEELPADPGLRFDNLKALVIANCRLTGKVPEWLSTSRDLQLLDLSWNQLSGTIPDWLGSFVDLFYLDLSNNSLTGEIPRNLTELPSLMSRDISLEDPSPDLPLFMKRNVSAGPLRYNQVGRLPPTLELSWNFLTGPIWPEFGNLKKLHIFDLNTNNLSGPIPSELSGMTSLETLDLSHNNFSGSIPWSLVNLSFLSKFNVAYNHLSGRIPVGGQFLTFSNSSFEGNDLCGGHGAPPCSETDVPLQTASKSSRHKGIIVGTAVGAVFVIAFILGMVLMIMSRAHKGEVDPEKEEANTNDKDLEEPQSRLVVLIQSKEHYKELSLGDLLESTNNFDQANIIGCGGFGLVYRATLPDGRKVAIKRLSGDCGLMEREFRAEVEALSRAWHPNLVPLQGYCMFKNDRLLIYPYMENSSLDYWLHEKVDGPSSLDWDTRLQIAHGAARGLAYLHQSCEPHIVHRDIKSSNILLDENFEARLADFGLARLILPCDTHVTTDLVGTLGYIPPEYGQASVATFKGDVYSFGVVLLELLTGKRPMDMCERKGSRDVISWVVEMKKQNRESEVFDPFIYEKQIHNELIRVLEIAWLCLSECPKLRPSMEQLVSWLDYINICT